MKNEVKIFVNGTCNYLKGHSVGNGRYGAVILGNGNYDEIFDLSQSFSNTTHPRMEILAIIKSIKQINNFSTVTVYLSNQYIIDAVTKGRLEVWKKKNFKKKKNPDLWLRFDSLIKEKNCSIRIKHSKEITKADDSLLFEYAKELAKESHEKVKMY
jgi:ribonuclease HI